MARSTSPPQRACNSSARRSGRSSTARTLGRKAATPPRSARISPSCADRTKYSSARAAHAGLAAQRENIRSSRKLSCRSDIYSDLSPSSVLFVRVGVRGDDVTKRVNARDENENNNTGFGVIRIQVASKSARAPLAGSDRYRYQYSCTGTGTIMIDSLHPLFCFGRSLQLHA